ncbi:MAG: GspH/FimT family pseudopilin [Betaproteobacteria bacterium]|nr:GspH/FimT family pseudopilin [Betaproteobacteria bacterium]
MTQKTFACRCDLVSRGPERNDRFVVRRRCRAAATLAAAIGYHVNLLRRARTRREIDVGRSRGFTLIEMLVVLMIIGLFAGLVSTITQPDERAVLRLEADRLSQLLDFAATEARLTGKSIAWTADESGYRFWRSGEDAGWLEIRDSELLRARTLPLGVSVSGFRVERMRPQGAMRLEFAPQGSSLAFTISLSLGAERYSVAGSPVGDVRVVPGEGKIDGDVALR